MSVQSKEVNDQVLLMAQAHLQNVQSVISDLVKQKESIEQEINKLSEYLKVGAETIDKFNSQHQTYDNVVSKVNYLGE